MPSPGRDRETDVNCVYTVTIMVTDEKINCSCLSVQQQVCGKLRP